MADFLCPSCGDPMVDGQIDYFCPKPECIKLDIKRAIKSFELRKVAEAKTLLEENGYTVEK